MPAIIADSLDYDDIVLYSIKDTGFRARQWPPITYKNPLGELFTPRGRGLQHLQVFEVITILTSSISLSLGNDYASISLLSK